MQPTTYVPYIDILQSEVNKTYDLGNVFTVERYNLLTKKSENLINYISGNSKHTILGFVESFVSEAVARAVFSQYSAEPKEDKNTILRMVRLSKTLVESRSSLPDYAVIEVVKYF
jgi:hypothetical protein